MRFVQEVAIFVPKALRDVSKGVGMEVEKSSYKIAKVATLILSHFTYSYTLNILIKFTLTKHIFSMFFRCAVYIFIKVHNVVSDEI